MAAYKLGNVMVDCADAAALQAFYAALLGWDKGERYGMPAVFGPEGAVFLFAQEDDYVPPVWPEAPGAQQKQMHFDFQAPVLPQAVERAVALGARLAPDQFGGEDFVTLFDPAGHPFCLCRED